MRARQLLRLLLAVQAGFALGIAALLLHNGVTGSWLLALAGGLGIVLLVRLLISVNNFLMTARFSSVTPEAYRVGFKGGLRLFAEEFTASMLHSSWFMAWAAPCERIYENSSCPPVLLLHGYGCNSGYWAHLTPLLDGARISHATLDLEPMMGAIDDYVPLVARGVASLCTKTNAPKVIIVAHSMGGLVARAYMRAHGTAQVAHVFTMGTPHHGTSLASMGVGLNAAQMRRAPGTADAPESAWLRELAAAESVESRALITSFYTHHDNIVAPQTSSLLPGARNVEFGGIGHVALGRNPRILARLMQELAKMCAQ